MVSKITSTAAPVKNSAAPPDKRLMLNAALAYAARGWPVLICHGIYNGKCQCGGSGGCKPGKHPLGKLIPKGLTEASTDPEIITAWYREYPFANLGLRCGVAFDVLDIDVDKGGDETLRQWCAIHGDLPETVEAISGGGGRHVFFKPDPRLRSWSPVASGTGIDTRCAGSFIVVEPSLHVSGARYHFDLLHHFEEVAIASWPAWLVTLILDLHGRRDGKTQVTGTKEPAPDSAAMVNEGERHGHLVSLAGKLRHDGVEPEEIRKRLHAENQARCVPPQTDAEVDQIADDAAKWPAGKPKRETTCEILLKIVSQEAELFHDQANTAYARVTAADHREIWPVNSSSFRRWLLKRFFEVENKAPSANGLASAISMVEGRAYYDGKQHRLSNRVAMVDGALWYDLTDPLWRAVRITENAWEIVTDVPILFTRYAHQAPQVEPLRGGDPRRIFDWIAMADEGDKLLTLVWIISCFYPDLPHPIPILHGPQGSGKSSIFRTIRRLVDPSTMASLSFPRDTNELVQKLSHHWTALFDNASTLNVWTSDALCRAVTGEGFSKRTLYTDDEDFIFAFKRCVGLNGINIMATRPDLLDRAILIGVDRIPPDRRRTEDELEESFEAVRGEILGGIFDTLVNALHVRDTVKLKSLPRMADFAVTGSAIAIGLGSSPGEFLKAYQANIKGQNEEVLAGSAVASAIVALMKDRTVWEGEPRDLLADLESTAERHGFNTHTKGWPKAAHILSRRIREVRTNLADAGISIDESKSGIRRIRIACSEGSESSAHSAHSVQSDAAEEVNAGRYLDATDATENSAQVASGSKALGENDLVATDGMDAKKASLTTRVSAQHRNDASLLIATAMVQRKKVVPDAERTA